MTKIVVLVPAHKEEAQIADTLTSLMNQDIELHRIVVIPNTRGSKIEDATSEIARQFPVLVDDFVLNPDRKSGAMNYGWRHCDDADFVFTMDADTILFPDTIRGMLKEFDDPEVGATCARYWAKAGSGMAWELQRIEYARYDDQRELRSWKVSVASGAAVMYRKEALEQVLEETGRMFPWDAESLIEDYALSLDIRELGWKVIAARGAHVLTDTPQSFKDLWDQRQRWGRGGFDEVRKRGWRKFLAYDISGYGMFAVNMTMRILFSVYFVLLMTIGAGWQLSLLGMIPLLVVWMSRVTSYLRLNGKTAKDAILVGVVIVEDLYGFFLELCAAVSIIRSMRFAPKAW